MKKLLLTLITSLTMMTGSLWAYELTAQEETLIDQLVIMLQKESPTKQQQITNMLVAAQQTLDDDRKLAIVDALLNAMYKADETMYDYMHEESESDFDAVYGEFLDQMRGENMQTYALDLMDEITETPAMVDLTVAGEIDCDIINASMDLYINPQSGEAEGALALTAEGEMEGQIAAEVKLNDDYVYVKINEFDAPTDALPGDVALGLQLLKGNWLQFPIEESDDITDNEWLSIQEDLQTNDDVELMSDMLTVNGVREYDDSREATDTYIPIMMTEAYRKQASAESAQIQYNFLQYGDERLLQSVDGATTQAIGRDTVYIQEKDGSTTTRATITSPDKQSLQMTMNIVDPLEAVTMNIEIDYTPADSKMIQYPNQVIDMSEMMEDDPTTSEKTSAMQ